MANFVLAFALKNLFNLIMLLGNEGENQTYFQDLFSDNKFLQRLAFSLFWIMVISFIVLILIFW